MKSLIASGSFIEKSVEDEMNNRHEHTHGKIKRERERDGAESGGGGHEKQTGARRLEFTLHRRCKQEAADGGADGNIQWD